MSEPNGGPSEIVSIDSDSPLLHHVVQEFVDRQLMLSERMKDYNTSIGPAELQRLQKLGGDSLLRRRGKEWMHLIASKKRRRSAKYSVSNLRSALARMKHGDGLAHVTAIGKLGGQATLKKYGPEYFRSLRQLQLLRKKQEKEKLNGTA